MCIVLVSAIVFSAGCHVGRQNFKMQEKTVSVRKVEECDDSEVDDGLDGYIKSCARRISPNFSFMSRADRKVFTAQARIDMAPGGRIINATIVWTSGDGAFDASVIQAIHATKYLECPPRPQDQRVTLTFSSDIMGASSQSMPN